MTQYLSQRDAREMALLLYEMTRSMKALLNDQLTTGQFKVHAEKMFAAEERASDLLLKLANPAPARKREEGKTEKKKPTRRKPSKKT